ncbi:L,D-transpeptidase family protein [Arcobacter roscoffensis]|uniref:L,D-transpeptidase family protein n=1 Tax=Arcobacter roscoffensis TaxID=2961520 RepID=A0ABY5E434_9BACT|nr:L,D-transpeptidase family protein [Arcobacter roscoffensis]UTJ05501.1 L,D-transpeptidase family protein [Arcobacter roscoffensis]
MFKILLTLFVLLNISSYANENINKNDTQIEEIKEATFKEKSQETIKNLLKNKKTKTMFLSRHSLRKYYKQFDYQLIWVDENGIKDIATNLFKTIKTDPVLKPEVEKIFRFSRLIKKLDKLDKRPEKYIESMAKIDFMLVSIYSKYMSYLGSGYINWKGFKATIKKLEEKDDIHVGWEKYNIRKNKIKLLKEALEKDDLSVAFDAVNYTFPQARQLEDKIKEFEQLAQAGGYVKLPKFKVLKEGSNSKAVNILRQRLLQSNDLVKNECEVIIHTENLVTNTIAKNNHTDDSLNENMISNQNSNIIENDCYNVFDKNVKEGVMSFQKNHGLVADGIVGAQTRRALNMSVEKKLVKMRLNLERMRWMPRTLGEKFLLVNIPEYKLRMYKNNEVALDMNIVVGKRKHPTPIFSNRVSYVVLNPYWKIPESIVEKELIPKVLKNPNYLKEKGINIHENWDYKSDTYELNEIDIKAMLPKEENKDIEEINLEDETIVQNQEVMQEQIKYRFIQVPSNTNPLGRMKFMFPNRYSVYLHDSPAKKYFNYTKRAYSHGCVRLAEPKKLLEAISKEDNNFDFDEAKEVLTQIDKKSIDLKKQIPVHMVYLTSWVDENGKLQFRNDIYRYDRIQKKLLYRM